SSVDLGTVYLQDVIDDNVYDWGHSVIKEDGIYKMWWVRPAVYDAIFYAESTDLKNWTNVQRVISLSPNSSNVTRYDNIKGMLGKPSVLHVGDTYYMYFEAPASEDPDVTQTVLEWDNQVMLATSSDGIEWEFYSDGNGQPKPVVAMPSELMGNFTTKEYGAGQPSAFYKDGTFYLTYCYVIYSQDIAEIRVATSTDGKNFGNISTHSRISGGNGLGVTYNVKTGKYMMCAPYAVMESDTLDFNDQVLSRDGNVFYTYDSTTIQTSFAEFIRNPHGLVDTETFYIIHLQGAKSTTSDWRAGYTTWDGHIHAVNPKEYQNRTITLPNGAAATAANLAGYRDRSNSYSRPAADAIYAEDAEIKIDGDQDEIYKKATRIVVSRPVYTYGSNLTDSWAEAWVAWNEGYLYVYARVYDNTPDNAYPILGTEYSYMHDSFDVFVDVPNDHGDSKNVSYGIEQYMICTDSNNTDFIIKGSGEYDLTDEFSGVRHRVKKTAYGYAVEWRVSWHEIVEDDIVENKCIGLDLQVNDAMGRGVGREATVVWSDHTGNAFQYVDNLGDVYLVKA
ncbi:MAG: sugar-binding protein, partial [Candidatus Gallimonas sp.]